MDISEHDHNFERLGSYAELEPGNHRISKELAELNFSKKARGGMYVVCLSIFRIIKLFPMIFREFFSSFRLT